ncbi:hypothetical protein FC20_GL000186 [Lactobacillus equicursoris DSM 19284 = JCM 14600 = CIP 110162]|uniref:Uncharacterized protein n=1 Tax=Lactobacillus equicursoris DSM 19284 = JCM 14600 = CIP 110162 TaxID=1293597 RepID=A0A0R1MEH8_9LACO|nr:hypothetical protein FC20_GL000186 [Lactobacillus equicursoris DSM 19284 = JCM 14600 = CIP 110162]
MQTFGTFLPTVADFWDFFSDRCRLLGHFSWSLHILGKTTSTKIQDKRKKISSKARNLFCS